MTKSKSQLRAEAVERLRNGDNTSLAAKLLGNDLPRLIDFNDAKQFKRAFENALIDLLTDDEPETITRDGIEEIMRNLAAEVTNGGVEVHGAIPIEDAMKSAMQRVDDLLTDDEPAQDEQDTREKLETDVREFANVYYADSLFVYDEVIELLDRQAAITKREAYQRGYDDGLHANTKAAFSAAKQAFGIRKPKKYNLAHESEAVNYKKADSLQDTREKLEEDVRHFANYWSYDDYLSDETVKEMRVKCMSELSELLDRQSSITEREICAKCEWPSLAAMPDFEQQQRIAEQDRAIVEYAEKVDELEADRRNWQDGYYLARLTDLETENEKLKEELRLVNTYSGVKGCDCETTVFGMKLDEVLDLKYRCETLEELVSDIADCAYSSEGRGCIGCKHEKVESEEEGGVLVVKSVCELSIARRIREAIREVAE